MTQTNLDRINSLLEANPIKFDNSLIERVNRNWLTLENPNHFKGLEGDQRLIAFMWLSNEKNCETSLGGDISRELLDYIIKND